MTANQEPSDKRLFSSCLLLGALPLKVFFCCLIDSSELLMGEEEAYRALVLLLPGKDEVSILVSGSRQFTSTYLFLRNSLEFAIVAAFLPHFYYFLFLPRSAVFCISGRERVDVVLLGTMMDSVTHFDTHEIKKFCYHSH